MAIQKLNRLNNYETARTDGIDNHRRMAMAAANNGGEINENKGVSWAACGGKRKYRHRRAIRATALWRAAGRRKGAAAWHRRGEMAIMSAKRKTHQCQLIENRNKASGVEARRGVGDRWRNRRRRSGGIGVSMKTTTGGGGAAKMA